MAGVSRDTVSKVEKIIKFLEEDNPDLEKLRSEGISINQAFNLILDKCNNNGLLAQQKEEDIRNKFMEEYGFKEFYAKMIFSAFCRLLSMPPTKRKRVNQRDEMSKILELIQMMKSIVAERG
jgi:hypothetical protein